MLPPVSEPRAYTHSPAATAAAGPPLLPPGTRAVSHGLRVGKKAEFSVDDPIANSSRLPFPSRTAPWSYSLRVTAASYGGTKSASIREEHVVRTPLVAMLSFNCIGMPVSAWASPAAMRSSALRACALARSDVTVTNAFNVGSIASMRSRNASANSTAETSPVSSSCLAFWTVIDSTSMDGMV